jgi:hypothetical protein
VITASTPSRLVLPELEKPWYPPAFAVPGLWALPLLQKKVSPSAVNFNVAKFCKIAPEILCQHHDALAFPDGSTVLVNSLVRGQRAHVLQLPVTGNELQSRNLKELPRIPEAETS